MAARHFNLLSALALPAAIAIAVQGGDAAPAATTPLVASTTDQVSYANDVAPIFQKSCVSCHGGMYEGEKRTEYGLDLTSYEGVMAGSENGLVVEPGDPDASYLVDMIASGDMPEEGDPLTPEQIETIRTWIAEGAKNN